MARDVFISYSSLDAAIADAVCAGVEEEGVGCWIAPRDILPGREWADAIIDGINGARTLVVVLSARSNDSVQVAREVERATSKGIPVIPFRIEDVKPTKSMEYFLSASHWLDAFVPPLELRVHQLAAATKAILADGDAARVDEVLRQTEAEGVAGLKPLQIDFQPVSPDEWTRSGGKVRGWFGRLLADR